MNCLKRGQAFAGLTGEEVAEKLPFYELRDQGGNRYAAQANGFLRVVLDDDRACAQFVQFGSVILGCFVALVAMREKKFDSPFYAGGTLAYEVDFAFPAGAERTYNRVLPRQNAAGLQLESAVEFSRAAPLRLIVGAVLGHRFERENDEAELFYDARATASGEAAAREPAPLTRSRTTSLLQSRKNKLATQNMEKTVDTQTPTIAALEAFIAEQDIDKNASNWRTRLAKPPAPAFEGGETYYWNLDTSHGAIKVRLKPEVAPMHVASTIYLTKLGFYDGLAFHRVITGFMAQGGCPLGRGTGGPGYQYEGEFDSSVVHDRPGLLSMANAGPGTDGSQFFLTFVPTPHLNGKHTIFGEVVEGMETLKKLEAAGSGSGQPREELSIRGASIELG